MARQQCVIDAIVGQVNVPTLLTTYQSLAGVAKENIVTDVPEDMFQPLLDLMLKVQGNPVASLPLNDDFFRALDPGMTSGDPDYDLIHAKIDEALSGQSGEAPAPGETTDPGSTEEPTDTTEADSASETPADEQDTLAAQPNSDSTDGSTDPDAEATPDEPHDAAEACAVSAQNG
jgi:polyisoprenyl-teichoic acid--peptidoglycan teichoic acid transferase